MHLTNRVFFFVASLAALFIVMNPYTRGFLLGAFGLSPVSRSNDASYARPTTRFETFRLLPSQRLTVQNKFVREIEVNSQFPISVETKACTVNYTVQFFCDQPPVSDIHIVDQRTAPLIGQPVPNVVVVKETAIF